MSAAMQSGLCLKIMDLALVLMKTDISPKWEGAETFGADFEAELPLSLEACTLVLIQHKDLDSSFRIPQ